MGSGVGEDGGWRAMERMRVWIESGRGVARGRIGENKG